MASDYLYVARDRSELRSTAQLTLHDAVLHGMRFCVKGNVLSLMRYRSRLCNLSKYERSRWSPSG